MTRAASSHPRPSGGSPISQHQHQHQHQHRHVIRPPTHQRATPRPEPPSPTLSKPVTIPSRNTSRRSANTRSSNATSQTQTRRDTPTPTTRHRKDALAPSVAALLAVTAIPPRKVVSKRRSDAQRTVSIDALVQEWKSEALSMPSYGSHKTMDILLDTTEAAHEGNEGSLESVDDYPDHSLSSRSASSDSIPSLDMDEQSFVSLGNPPTPTPPGRTSRAGSLSASARKARPRSLTPTEDCALDHPLIPRSTADLDDDLLHVPTTLSIPTSKTLDRRKSSFKSNLTLSLQSLKSRISSLSQLTLNNAGPQLSNTPYAFSDDTLWSHPYLFPRLSPEVRPVSYSGLPTEAERHYFNPTVLCFEEEQARYRRALHSVTESPYSHTSFDEPRVSPMIQMKTYTRPAPKRKAKSVSPNSEAGRALAGPPLVRQREPRENSDFLRVVVLEMNMRRMGKLEETMSGRARIWLPPRQNVVSGKDAVVQVAERTTSGRSVPRRWTSIVVDE
ncbi:Vacuolar protein sorting-associated protein 18 [Sphaceloma murrayae]|uniref:Vacuolar protein sorting-associated protein 18 n=1 Tax=Sphaceloma murrayae TaxID=2082308 RepID=A0A2K1QWH1_9PEZI|nr:Vacuolar protein sorting-associated protein 18 [Sphaceloma murrayae]